MIEFITLTNIIARHKIWEFDKDNPNLLKFNRSDFRYPSTAKPYLEWLKLWSTSLNDLDNNYYSYILSPEAKTDFLLRWD